MIAPKSTRKGAKYTIVFPQLDQPMRVLDALHKKQKTKLYKGEMGQIQGIRFRPTSKTK